jgi:hypothetical protein
MAGLPFDHDDGMVQHAVLTHVLCEHPIIFTVSELIDELGTGPEEFARRDAIERAVRDLERVRLLHRHGPLILPTRAALYFGQLWDEYQ